MDFGNHDNQENMTPQQLQRPGVNAAKRMQDALTESDAENRQLRAENGQLREELTQARLLEQWRTEERRAKRQRRKENKARKMINNDRDREAPGAPKAARKTSEDSEVSIGELFDALIQPSHAPCHELFSMEEIDEAMAELEELEKELEKEKPPPCCSWGGSSSSSGSPPPPPPPPPSPAIC